MEKYDVIIIGAGASGIMCALNTSKKTLLLEASDRIGKKILATGNGKCNLTNDCVTAAYYNTSRVAPYLAQFDQVQTLKYFENLGVFTYADEAGRRYPLSNSANSVLDLMLKALNTKSNVTTMVNVLPKNVAKKNDVFVVTTENNTYYANQLVLATGGNSGMQYLQQLKVNYCAFKPSLMGLKTNKNKGLAGVRVSNVRVRCCEFDEVGEILFKDDGISGIVIFNLSAYLARNDLHSGVIKIDLLTKVEAERLLEMLQGSVKNHPQYAVNEILEGILHKSLARCLVEKLGLQQKLAHDCDKSVLQALVSLIKNFEVVFTGYADNNQVHTGGVDLQDLDEHLQHKRVRNLYLVGEVVNVDGVCGGYNLQWAWTSGRIVGQNLSNIYR